MMMSVILQLLQMHKLNWLTKWSAINSHVSICSHHMPVRLKDSPKSQRTRLQHAEWLGNSTALIIITENDIYLRQSPADEEDIRLTHTGVPGLIYNGITDWLYQGEHLSSSAAWIIMKLRLIDSPSSFSSPFLTEEIFKSQRAVWGSNDGSMLLYATFNDTNVGQMMYPWFSSNPLIQSGKSSIAYDETFHRVMCCFLLLLTQVA